VNADLVTSLQKMFISYGGGIMINYYDNPAMSQSKLKDLKRSPKHFWTKHLALDRVPDTEVSHY
jgi:hypothetical protein